MSDETILCWTWPEAISKLQPSEQRRHVTVKDCSKWFTEGQMGKQKLAAFFEQRMRERYIEPVKSPEPEKRNGFSIMALSCLLLESLECFHRGWPKTEGPGQEVFCGFFNRDARFKELVGHTCGFYKNVRCGILHQGETMGGWTIRREGHCLFDPAGPTVDATLFHALLAESLTDYAAELTVANSQAWPNFEKKLRSVINNCKGQT